jgi:hypothetical protein
MPSPSLPISALPEIRELIDGAENILKADISRIKKLLADPDATLPPSIVAFTLQEAKDALDLLAAHSRQLKGWQKETIGEAERAEIARLLGIVPEIRPLIQRLIALATELDRRAKGGTASPRKRWRH